MNFKLVVLILIFSQAALAGIESGPKRDTGDFGKCTKELKRIAEGRLTSDSIKYYGDSIVSGDDSGNVFVYTTSGRMTVNGGATSCNNTEKNNNSFGEAAMQIRRLIQRRKSLVDSSAPAEMIKEFTDEMNKILKSCSSTKNEELEGALAEIRTILGTAAGGSSAGTTN